MASVVLIALIASIAFSGCASQTQENTETTGQDSLSSSIDPSGATLLNEGILTVLLSPDYPPFENLEEGELVGFEVELFQKIADMLGLEYNPVYMPFDAIIPAIVAGGQGDIGVSGFTVTPEREEIIDFTDAFYIDNQGIAVKRGSAITAENAEKELDRAGVVIACQIDTTSQEFVEDNFPNAVIQGYVHPKECFDALVNGQANAVCSNLGVVEDFVEDGDYDVELIYEAFTDEATAAVVTQGNTVLTEKINEALGILQENGTIASLEKKWFGTKAQ